jgi:hypothetical protein
MNISNIVISLLLFFYIVILVIRDLIKSEGKSICIKTNLYCDDNYFSKDSHKENEIKWQ